MQTPFSGDNQTEETFCLLTRFLTMAPLALVQDIRDRKQLRHLAPVDAQQKLIQMWLHGKATLTQSAYQRIITKFLGFVGKSLPEVTLEDLHDYWMQLETQGNSTLTQENHLSAIKSLFSFAAKMEYIEFNVGSALKIKRSDDNLTERYLSKEEVDLLIDGTTNTRDYIILTLLYKGGLRVSELCGLKWKDLMPRGDSGQITVLGKGNKRRSIRLPLDLWQLLLSLRGNAPLDAPVFVSHKTKGHLHRQNIHPIVKAAALRAGVNEKASCHWLRHAHATHSILHGTNLALIQKTLGHSNIAITSKYLHALPDDSSALYL
ncbi:phage integrase family protein [Tolypothrix sp. NIES-4075]|uniref:tyrosine-type recombinase/integrase n=1 Tax=Tolypothrix sp. NIES-4075 TaxID=2005459 RepID=UPI000B71776D|nr:tyrosine-type recombinase/integrase [Tolypothrix sp. NIES-4075]GAX46051.1 phage integrase family protein [Tolypothrix sp. NIES-4075]